MDIQFIFDLIFDLLAGTAFFLSLFKKGRGNTNYDSELLKKNTKYLKSVEKLKKKYGLTELNSEVNVDDKEEK